MFGGPQPWVQQLVLQGGKYTGVKAAASSWVWQLSLSWLKWQPGVMWGLGDMGEDERGTQRMKSKADPLQARRGEWCAPMACLSLFGTKTATLRHGLFRGALGAIPRIVKDTCATKKFLLRHSLAHCMGFEPSLGGMLCSGCWGFGVSCTAVPTAHG